MINATETRSSHRCTETSEGAKRNKRRARELFQAHLRDVHAKTIPAMRAHRINDLQASIYGVFGTRLARLRGDRFPRLRSQVAQLIPGRGHYPHSKSLLRMNC